MATHKGLGGQVKIGASALGQIQDYSLTINRTEIPTTDLDDDFRTFVGGLIEWSGTAKAFFDEDDAQHDLIHAEMLASGDGLISDLRLDFTIGSSTNGYWAGNVIITEVSFNNPGPDGLMEMSFSFKGNGAIAWTDAT